MKKIMLSGNRIPGKPLEIQRKLRNVYKGYIIQLIDSVGFKSTAYDKETDVLSFSLPENKPFKIQDIFTLECLAFYFKNKDIIGVSVEFE